MPWVVRHALLWVILRNLAALVIVMSRDIVNIIKSILNFLVTAAKAGLSYQVNAM